MVITNHFPRGRDCGRHVLNEDNKKVLGLLQHVWANPYQTLNPHNPILPHNVTGLKYVIPDLSHDGSNLGLVRVSPSL